MALYSNSNSYTVSFIDPDIIGQVEEPDGAVFETDFGEAFYTGVIDVQDSEGNSLVVDKIAKLPPLSSQITKLSDLEQDEEHRTVSDVEKAEWNAKYTKPLDGIGTSDLSDEVNSALQKANNAMPADTFIPSTAADLGIEEYSVEEINKLFDTI